MICASTKIHHCLLISVDINDRGRLTPSYYSTDIFNSINKHYTRQKVGCFKTVPESRFSEALYIQPYHRYDITIGIVGNSNVPLLSVWVQKAWNWNSKVCNLVAVNNGKRFLCFSHGLRCRSECVAGKSESDVISERMRACAVIRSATIPINLAAPPIHALFLNFRVVFI